MKHIYTSLIATLLVAGTATAVGQTYDDIDWSKYASGIDDVVSTDESNPTFVYLYNVDNKKFLTNGGSYGMQGILANVGMRFIIIQKSSVSSWSTTYPYYTISSRIDNSEHEKGSYVAIADNLNNVFFDRSSGDGFIGFKFNSADDEASKYTIQNIYISGYYIGYGGYYIGYENQILTPTNSTGATNWYLITEAKYKEAIYSITDDQYVDVSGWIKDSRFDRNSKDVGAWNITVGTTTTAGKIGDGDDSYVYKPYFKSVSEDSQDDGNGAFVTARLGNETEGATLSQTITGLRPGYYRVTCQAFYNGESDNTNAYLFANGGSGDVKVLIPNISSADSTTLSTKNTTGDDNRAIAAGSIFADGNNLADGTNETIYFVELTVTVGEDGTLTIGATKGSGDGEVYLDNFRLFYINTKGTLYLSANEPKTEQIDNTAYTKPQEAYYRRSFTMKSEGVGTWEPICLPFDLSNSNVLQAFGNDVQLGELQGIQGNRIVFTKVDLGVSNSAALKANKCYVIKTTKLPDYDVNTTVEFFSSKFNSNITRHGPIYKVPVAKQDAYNEFAISGTAQADGYGAVDYTCYYYKTSVPVGAIILNAGTMYELTVSRTIPGTTWTLSVGSGSSNAKTVSINGEENDLARGTTDIANITETTDNEADAVVYNLNGAVVGKTSQTDQLPKGIYITRGKKIVVR